MSDSIDRRPDGTFKKGHTANRNGAPPKARRRRPTLPIDILFHEKFDPRPEDLPPGLPLGAEAAYRTYCAALDGSKRARRLVLEHVKRRHGEVISRWRKKAPPVTKSLEPNDPKNANDALVVLGIAIDHDTDATNYRCRVLRFQSWAVQAALKRRHGGRRLSADEINNIKLFTLDADQLRFPRGYNEKIPRATRPSSSSAGRSTRLLKRSRSFDAVLSILVTVKKDGERVKIPAEQAFLLDLRNKSRHKDASASQLLTEYEDFSSESYSHLPIMRVSRIVIAPGSLSRELEILRMAKKFDRFSNNSYLKLEPWIVEAALARLGDKKLTAMEQRIVYEATRTPGKVIWPGWWSTELRK